MESITINAILVWLIIGAIAGYLAGVVVTGYGFGLVGNIVIGILGAALGGWLFPQLGFELGGGPLIATIINATLGAILLLLAIGFVRRA